jgi:hypothetical protein
MSTKPTSYDFLPLGRGFANVAGHKDAYAALDTSDAELYRIAVAHALREGRFRTKADYDAEVRALGTVARADEVIGYHNLRPGCRVFQEGGRMMCECGVSWKVDTVEPIPNCKSFTA